MNLTRETLRAKIQGKSAANEALCLFFFFILFEPRCCFQFAGIKTVFKFALMAVSLLLFVLYITLEWKKWSKETVLCLVYHAYLCGVTILRKADYFEIIEDSLFFCSLCILTEYCLKYNPRFLYTKLYHLLALEVLVNYITVLTGPLYASRFIPEGYFLGYRNQMINVILPALLLGFMNVMKQGKWSRATLAALFAVSFHTVFLLDSKASILIVLLMASFCLTYVNWTGLCNMATYLTVDILAFIAVVILQVQKSFAPLIALVFPGRDASFTGRDVLWNETMDLIKLKPIFGYGVETYTYRMTQYPSGMFYAGLHAHNRFLETLFRGGIILFLIYLAMLVLAAYFLTRSRKKDVAKLVSLTLFVYLVGMLTEFYRYSYFFFPMMVMAEYIGNLQASIDQDLKAIPEGERRILGLWPRKKRERG